MVDASKINKSVSFRQKLVDSLNPLLSNAQIIPGMPPFQNLKIERETEMDRNNFQKMVRDLRNTGDDEMIYGLDDIRYNMNGSFKFDTKMLVTKWKLYKRRGTTSKK